MAVYVVCLDSEHAKIYKLAPGGTETQALQKHEVKHHTSHESSSMKSSASLYHDVATKLSDASQILLMGPGVAKDQFKHHLDNHHHGTLAKKIVGTQNLDLHHMTEGEILKRAHEFFRQYDVFNG